MLFALGSVLLTAAVVFFILQPLITGRRASLVREDEEMTETEARRRVTLLALRDVEYDYVTGKLDAEDYGTLKLELSAEALAALDADEREATKSAAPTVEDVEREIAAMRVALRSGTACVVCGHENPQGSRFCSACGRPLAAAAG